MTQTLKNKAKTVVQALNQKGLTVATAESCTGGLLSTLITSVSGASNVFGLGICSYSATAKSSVLKVCDETLEKFGTVSEQTAKEMAENVRILANADIGVSITGVAGPSQTENKPVGLVFIALSHQKSTKVKKLNVENHGRDFIRNYAAAVVFDLIINYLSWEEN